GSVFLNFLAFSFASIIAHTASAQIDFLTPFSIQEPEIIDRYKNLYNEKNDVESFDPVTGQITLSTTDISIPGNFDIPVELTRWIPLDDLNTGGMADWNIDIPVIKANYIHARGGRGLLRIDAAGWGIGKNCSGTYADRVFIDDNQRSHEVYPSSYWSGILLHIPRKTTEKLLKNAGG